MGRVLSFINNNAIIASLITLFLTTIINIIFKKSDRTYNEKQKRIEENKIQFLNKGELHIERKQWDSRNEPDICLLLANFNVEVNDKNDIEFLYDKNILKKNSYKHTRFYMRNIGNSDINQLDICVTNQKRTMLCNVGMIDSLVETKFVSYSCCYDRKIMKDDVILIDIAYLEDSHISSLFSSELVLLFRDSYGNLYKQPFFLSQNNLYEPSKISNKDYSDYILPDKALECFRNPGLW